MSCSPSLLEETATDCTQSSTDLALSSVDFIVESSYAETVRQQVVPLPRQRAQMNKPGQSGPPDLVHRTKVERALNATSIQLEADDGVMLDAVWCVPQPSNYNKFAAVLSHGDGMTLDSMSPWAEYYRDHGFHVLLMTMRGHHGSDGDSDRDGEPGIYRDAAAAVNYVADQGFDASHTLAHGFSLGGALAAAAACQHVLAALTLDHTCTSPEHVATPITGESFFPSWLAAGEADGAYRPGVELERKSGATIPADGLDILAKVGSYEGTLFVIYGSRDYRGAVPFASMLLEARYAEQNYVDMQPPVFVELDGGHCDHMFYEDLNARSIYWQHLDGRLIQGDAPKECLLPAAPSTPKHRRRNFPKTLLVSGFSLMEMGFNGEYDLDRSDRITTLGYPTWHRRSDSVLFGMFSLVPSWITFSTSQGCWVLKSGNGHRLMSGLGDPDNTPTGVWLDGIQVEK